jgi:hypothetical protein
MPLHQNTWTGAGAGGEVLLLFLILLGTEAVIRTQAGGVDLGHCPRRAKLATPKEEPGSLESVMLSLRSHDNCFQIGEGTT